MSFKIVCFVILYRREEKRREERILLNMDCKDILEPNHGNECQISNAVKFVQEMSMKVKEQIQELNNDIKSLEEYKIELDNNILSLDSLNNRNADFFSPSVKNNKQHQIDEFKEKLIETEEKIRQKNQELTDIGNKCICIDDLNHCFDDFQFYYIEHIKKSEKSENFNFDNLNRRNGINLLQAQENERKRIARDLHDSTVQSLTNLKHKSELITRLIDMDSVRAKLELQSMIQTLKSTIDEMRNVIYDLRPMSIDDLGLIATINKYINEIRINNAVEIILNVSEEEYGVLPVINLTLFRIIQEAITNVLKHAKATKITINLNYNYADILLSICDNGIGFNPDDINTSDENQSRLNGFGLSIMKERIFLLSGKIEIISSESKGTQVIVSVPIEPERTNTEDI
jgi:two-component system sensor histidine kinase DegS